MRTRQSLQHQHRQYHQIQLLASVCSPLEIYQLYWMKELDKKAGTIVFSALSRDDLMAIFRHEAEAVLSDAKN